MPPVLDRTVQFFTQGYRFTERLRRSAPDPLSAYRVGVRMLGEPALIVRGDEGVQLFYDRDSVKREGALPVILSGSLFGKGAVHGLDGEEHLHRKDMFVRAAMPKERVDALLDIARGEWDHAIADWQRQGEGVVYDTAVDVYGRSVMRWAGVPFGPQEATQRSRVLGRIVEDFGAPGLPMLRAWRARAESDAWSSELIGKARRGEVTPPQDSALAMVADHRDLRGDLLDEHTAGVELQNILRPTIAVSRFAAFAALALIDNPGWAERLRTEALENGTPVGGRLAVAFAQEVRRIYPFVPMLPALALRTLDVRGESIKPGQRVFIDITGTNRDERHWEQPNGFDPGRFLDTDAEDSDHFVPQGGGRPETGHRCPGEDITVGLLALTAARLACLDCRVPDQDLDYSLSRLPTKPHSGVRLSLLRDHMDG